MRTATIPRRIDDAMVDVVGKMNIITEHMRKLNFEDSSNRIARDVHQIVGVFTAAVSKFDEHDMIMEDVVPRRFNHGDTVENDNGRDIKPKDTEANGETSSSSSSSGKGKDKDKSWANVASASGGFRAGMVPPTQPRKMAIEKRLRRLPTGPILLPVGTIQPIETEEEKGGSILISGKFPPGALNYITSKIREGPVFSVEISPTARLAEITFQRASHAFALEESDQKVRERLGHGRFGSEYEIVVTEAVEWTPEIEQMENRPKERRRLTFARAGFLGKPFTLNAFKDDVACVAGAENIDFIWAFNTGNVTTVFNSVPVARKVQKYFLAKAEMPGPYKGVQITFSTDPCEKPLNLGSQGGVYTGYPYAVQKVGTQYRRK